MFSPSKNKILSVGKGKNASEGERLTMGKEQQVPQVEVTKNIVVRPTTDAHTVLWSRKNALTSTDHAIPRI